MLNIHHPEAPVGNLDYVISCLCGWESAHAGDGAELDAITAGGNHLMSCALTPHGDADWGDPFDPGSIDAGLFDT